MKIRRISIRNFRGIRELDRAVDDAGLLVKGKNASGKSSLLGAIRAALVARDVSPDAISKGADKCEILIDLDAVDGAKGLQARRTITQSGQTLKVVQSDGAARPSPQTFLKDLLATSPYDPVDLFLSKAEDRRKKILQALPVTVTLEQLRQWAPDLGDFDTGGHGLEVIERARKLYYDRRADANRVADADKREAARLAAAVPAGEPLREDLPSEQDAVAALEALRDEAKRLHYQAVAAKAATENNEASRKRAEELRATAKEKREAAAKERCTEEDLRNAGQRLTVAQQHVVAFRAQLAKAEEDSRKAADVLQSLHTANAKADDMETRAANFEATALEIEHAMAKAEGVSEETVAALDTQIKEAERVLATVKSETVAAHARLAAEDATERAKESKAVADKHDAVVKALSNEAPAALLAGAQAIPGLGLTDDDDVTLDGVRLGSLSASEQLKFAVEIARRLNAKTKILVIDNLERIDPDAREDFVRLCRQDDWQLIGSIVDRGELHFGLVEPDEPKPVTGKDAARAEVAS